ncbi:MAG: glycosyltransferase family A protein [Candidatus Bathyarchaeia archaeon]
MEPKVSVFWINYNSIHVIDIIKKSLSALLRLEYPNYELIIVDNGSTDGSLRVIEKHIKIYKKKRMKILQELMS